jgi:hypothetical protein
MPMGEQLVLRQLTCIYEEHGLNLSEGLVTLDDVFRFSNYPAEKLKDSNQTIDCF